MRYWVYNAQPAGPAMVLVHGLAGSHHGFEALAAQLPGVQLIVPDVPGFGYSSLPPRRDWTVAGLARLLNQFVAALAMQSPPYLLGHSMGGLVASCMVAQSPGGTHAGQACWRAQCITQLGPQLARLVAAWCAARR